MFEGQKLLSLTAVSAVSMTSRLLDFQKKVLYIIGCGSPNLLAFPGDADAGVSFGHTMKLKEA
jgi:hypothetical protein